MAKIEIEPVILNWIKNQNASGGTLTPAPSLVIENCEELFYNNRRVEIVNDLLKYCKPTNARFMFTNSTNLVDITTEIDMSSFTNVNNARNMFTGATNLSDDSLYIIMESFKTFPDAFINRSLSNFGFSSDQIATIKTLSNWDDLVALGWSE